jgi:Rps23 Pro-64 3,4-dihydroxylase Tpa1-like proline 4-hydroxylase
MPIPCQVLPDAFEAEFVARLLDYALANERRFTPSQVIGEGDGAVDRRSRVSLVLTDLGDLKREIRGRLSAMAPALAAQLGLPPFELAKIEVELVAHNDGAFFDTHVDSVADEGGARVLSAVHYFHRLPRGNDGGALRLYDLRPREGAPRFRDVEPQHNALVAFPSWVPHEVRPVTCPSGRFADSRFAVNAWFLGSPPSRHAANRPASR